MTEDGRMTADEVIAGMLNWDDCWQVDYDTYYRVTKGEDGLYTVEDY
jgi:hypothetical protein